MASCPGGRWCPGALSGPGDEDVIEVGSEEPDSTVPRGAERVESRGGDPPCRLHLQEAAPPTIDGSQAGRDTWAAVITPACSFSAPAW